MLRLAKIMRLGINISKHVSVVAFFTAKQSFVSLGYEKIER